MTKIVWAALGGLAVLAALSDRTAEAQPKELPAEVVTLSGTAELHRKDTPAWKAAELRDLVGEGDSLRTQVGGRTTLKTASGQALRLGSRSQVAFVASEPGSPIRARLDNGWLWVAVSPNSPPPTQVEVRSGPTVVTVRSGGVGLRRGPEGALLVQVHYGVAQIAGPERRWERTLTGPMQLLIPTSGAPAAPAPLTVEPIEATWAKWNADQDAAGGYGVTRPTP
jgi:ferric-dicitrate binding protein FerR (iron transport regulator)